MGGSSWCSSKKNKVEVERKFASLVPKRELRRTRVIFRTGELQSVASFQLVGVATARCVVLMSSGDQPRRADASTLRVLIALRVAGLQPGSFVVAEVRDPEMDTVIKITGGSQHETIRSAELNAKVSLSAVKQPGIMLPYEDLFGFDGSEVSLGALILLYLSLSHHFPACLSFSWLHTKRHHLLTPLFFCSHVPVLHNIRP